MDIFVISTRKIHQETTEFFQIFCVHCCGSSNEVNIIWGHIERIENSSKQERHLRRSCTYIGMSFIKDNPLKRIVSSGRLNHPSIGFAQEHIFKHRRIGNEQMGHFATHKFARIKLCRMNVGCCSIGRIFFQFACVKCIPDGAIKWSSKAIEAFLLINNERIERIKEQGADTLNILFCVNFTNY